ncbi:Uncharacterized protein DAT39_004918, partial [Clarias magur]
PDLKKCSYAVEGARAQCVRLLDVCAGRCSLRPVRLRNRTSSEELVSEKKRIIIRLRVTAFFWRRGRRQVEKRRKAQHGRF